MTKPGFWKSDWFLGLIVVAVMLLAGSSELLQSLERKAYDLGAQASTRTPSNAIAVIAIDDASIANIGRWPWPRDVHARMTDLLAAAGAKVIASTIFFSEPQVDPGYAYIAKLLELASKSAQQPNPPSGSQQPIAPAGSQESASPAESGAGPATPSAGQGELAQFVSLLQQAERSLNTDRTLAESYAKAGDVLLPMLFVLGQPLGKPDQPLPAFVAANAIGNVQGNPALSPLTASAIQVPIELIGHAAAGLGHLNFNVDVDGAVRTEPLVVQYYDRYFPSLPLLIAAKFINLGPADIRVRLGEGVSVGNLSVATDPAMQMYTYFYRDHDGKPAFQPDSFYDVLSGKIAPAKYRGKIVLIGATAAGVGTTYVTPISPAMPPVLTLAHEVSSILQGDYFVAPTWGWIASKAMFALIGLYLIVLLPRLNAGPAAAVTGVILILLLGAQFGLMTMRATWIQLMVPATLLLVGHLALVSKRFIVTERAKMRSDETSAESNRMLGLAYQGQGQLDMAWDKFRQVPLSDAVMDNLYNLALDFERKRQFNKAESVFRHMAGFNPKFRDLEQRLSRAQQLSETVMLGSAGARTNVSILGPGGTVEKPMLGRYQVEKELGKGAMGVVYLGKDPKIGRVVAIKTLALSQEFEPDELAEVKERFFREAETAGRLSHPNIVTIYDAGEEHDLCYIAMELLKGGDLIPFTKAAALLPVPKVVSIVARVAEALGYAHRQGVVHRDVKPGNVMFHAESDLVKVTDFGIARLTDSSKTKTGMVLGTPSYMSPEQLAGKKIDGRSDLFSLAASLYQLLSGRLPFEGESMAQLMFKIANEPPTDIRTLNPAVPPSLAAFLARAMAKDADARFQTGEEFAAALRAAYASAAPPTGAAEAKH